MPAMRSLLFVPGNRPDMLEKALGFSPDVYIPDMEDSVPLREKARGREAVASFLPRLAAAGPLVVPRVNSLESGLFEDDLAAVVSANVFGVSVGKIGSATDIERVSVALAGLEKKMGMVAGAIKIVPWIETAKAVVNAYEICAASPRVVAAAFGAEDFTSDMGIQRTESGSEIFYPRSVVSVAAKAADVVALDTPYFKFRDLEGLREDALVAKRYGFMGKFAIHPAQVDIINEVFAPSPEEIEHARRVIEAYEEAERSGSGATSLDGKVIDEPVVVRARNLLESAGEVSGAGQAGE